MCSARSPKGYPSRAWRRSRPCWRTAWNCCSTMFPPEACCLPATPSGSGPGPPTWSAPARSSSRPRGSTPRRAGIPAPAPVPDTLDWDLWLGSAPARPYTDGGTGYPTEYGYFYQPFNWRGFYDFGCGALGDMACHILGAPNLALKLGVPTSVECIHKEGASDFMFPKKSTIRFDFPVPLRTRFL